jgi:carbamoyltransferase
MIVLGISGVFGHDPAACLVQDGRVVAMVEEERLTRNKHGFGELPISATLYCVAEAGITLADIDCVAASWNPSLDPTATHLQEFATQFFNHDIWRSFRKPNIEYVDHHLAHAASAFFSSGYPEGAILVIDGNGENVATSVGCGQGTQIRLDAQYGVSHSLGHFYKNVTQFVGLGDHDEGKLMGLAAYGKSISDFEPIRLLDDGYSIDIMDVDPLPAYRRFKVLWHAWRSWLVNHFGEPSSADYQWDSAKGRVSRRADLLPKAADIAASAQEALTRVVLHLVEQAVRRYKTRRLVMAGGVALNCSTNGAILGSGLVEELYIVPAAHDAGGSLGAAQYLASTHERVQPLATPYLGPKFARDDIAQLLRRTGVSYCEPHDIAKYTAEILAGGKTVGWFQGRAEVGPRALGGRSILALPTSTGVRDHVNRLKGREMWRPLSPSILNSAASVLLERPHPSPYMLLALQVTEHAKELMPGVVHVDSTARPQTVTEREGRYCQLLEAVYNITGVPGVLNTSFNLAGEPIVATPNDAIRSFFNSELDVLVLGDFAVQKQGNGTTC